MASRHRPTRLAASDAFPKVRRDHARETAEDYVEAIGDLGGRGGTCRVADLARHMRVSHVTVVRTIARLSAAGLVEKERYGPVRLTPSGARMAAAARMREVGGADIDPRNPGAGDVVEDGLVVARESPAAIGEFDGHGARSFECDWL